MVATAARPGLCGLSHLNAAPVAVLTSGEPAGIGPDICLQLAAEPLDARFAALGDPAVLAARAGELGLGLRVSARGGASDVEAHVAGVLQVLPVNAAAPVIAGRLDAANASYVLEQIRRGTALCLDGAADALVTAPVQKSVIAESGIPFTGHTELLAELTGAQQPVMLLVAGPLRVALATTHLPLRAVADALDEERLLRILRVLHADLGARLGIHAPRILVLGLNPHAGERGLLGAEERTIIEPAVRRAADEGMHVLGPVPADTAFTRESLERCDAVLAMYHDQGLPVIKAVGFGATVNVTCGLPIVRTSVDHGTALDLAGTGRARHDSLRAALELALAMAARAAACRVA